MSYFLFIRGSLCLSGARRGDRDSCSRHGLGCHVRPRDVGVFHKTRPTICILFRRTGQKGDRHTSSCHARLASERGSSGLGFRLCVGGRTGLLAGHLPCQWLECWARGNRQWFGTFLPNTADISPWLKHFLASIFGVICQWGGMSSPGVWEPSRRGTALYWEAQQSFGRAMRTRQTQATPAHHLRREQESAALRRRYSKFSGTVILHT